MPFAVAVTLACPLASVVAGFGVPSVADAPVTGLAVKVTGAPLGGVGASGPPKVTVSGWAKGWLMSVVCGLPPVYAMLHSLRGQPRGRLAFYAQCAADEDGGSLVSIASVVYGDAQ